MNMWGEGKRIQKDFHLRELEEEEERLSVEDPKSLKGSRSGLIQVLKDLLACGVF